MPVDYHAWTHRPKALGGTDPLEIAGGYRNPVTTYKFGPGIEWGHIDDGGYYNDFGLNVDTTAPGGYNYSNEGSGSAGDAAILGAMLGPKGSAWYPDIVYKVGPTGGRFTLEVQTQPVDYSAAAPNLITPPAPGGTWVTWLTSAECYAGSAAWQYVSGWGGQLVVSGDDGAMLAAETGFADIPPYPADSRNFNGGGDGSVMWYWRFRVLTAVHASNVSGDRDIWLASFRLSRVMQGPKAVAW